MSLTIYRQEDAARLTFDNTLGETYNPSISTTDHPIEKGADVTDHARANPLTFSSRLQITETPFISQGGVAGYARVQDALTFLRGCEGKLVDVVSSRLGTFKNCLITGYPHDVTVVRNMVFNISFKQVRIASSQVVIIEPKQPRTTVAATNSDKLDAGQQAGEEDESDKGQEAVGFASTLSRWTGIGA